MQQHFCVVMDDSSYEGEATMREQKKRLEGLHRLASGAVWIDIDKLGGGDAKQSLNAKRTS